MSAREVIGAALAGCFHGMADPQAAADRLLAQYDAETAAKLESLRKDRDAFRDQRNAVFATNERLLAEVQESDQARLQAENETRTVRRKLAKLSARVDALQADAELLAALHARGVDSWEGYDAAVSAARQAVEGVAS